jgi:hypothetical protein
MHRLAAAILALTVTQEAAPPPGPEAVPSPASSPAVQPLPGGPAPAPRPRTPAAPPPSRDLLLRAALAFADALVRGDAVALADASASRFSFDGASVDGREAQVRRWREILSSRRAGSPDVLRDLILLTGEEAAAQLGPPPPRIEGWARPGAWLAVADVSGRPVVLLLAPDGGRWAVAGMSD